MTQNDFFRFMVSYAVFYIATLLIDKRFGISRFIRTKLNINTKGKVILSSGAAALIVGILSKLILGSGSSNWAITFGVSMGIIVALQVGINSAFTKNRSSIQK